MDQGGLCCLSQNYFLSTASKRVHVRMYLLCRNHNWGGDKLAFKVVSSLGYE